MRPGAGEGTLGLGHGVPERAGFDLEQHVALVDELVVPDADRHHRARDLRRHLHGVDPDASVPGPGRVGVVEEGEVGEAHRRRERQQRGGDVIGGCGCQSRRDDRGNAATSRPRDAQG